MLFSSRGLSELNHPNVAQIFGVDHVDDTCFLVLELVPGESLEARLKRELDVVLRENDVEVSKARQFFGGGAAPIERDVDKILVFSSTRDGNACSPSFPRPTPRRRDWLSSSMDQRRTDDDPRERIEPHAVGNACAAAVIPHQREVARLEIDGAR